WCCSPGCKELGRAASCPPHHQQGRNEGNHHRAGDDDPVERSQVHVWARNGLECRCFEFRKRCRKMCELGTSMVTIAERTVHGGVIREGEATSFGRIGVGGS